MQTRKWAVDHRTKLALALVLPFVVIQVYYTCAVSGQIHIHDTSLVVQCEGLIVVVQGIFVLW